MHKIFLETEANSTYISLLTRVNLPDLEIVEKRSDATLLLAAPPLVHNKMDEFSSLQWFQSEYAGIDALMGEGARQEYILTNVKDIFGPLIAEYVVGYCLSFFRHFQVYAQQQKVSRWQPRPYNSLAGKQIIIVGTGSIGNHLAGVVKSFGMVPLGVNREGKHPEKSHFHEIVESRQIKLVLKSADIIVSALPKTPFTDRFFDKDIFSSCRNTLFFNIGRGEVVDENALKDAIDYGCIRHAFLDVFTTEPLPDKHQFWKNEAVTITPHIAAVSFPEQVFEIFVENYKRYIAGKQLKYQIDFTRGY